MKKTAEEKFTIKVPIKVKKIGWNKVKNLVQFLYYDLGSSRKEYDTILGIARGGVVPAYYLWQLITKDLIKPLPNTLQDTPNLSIRPPNFSSIQVTHYKGLVKKSGVKIGKLSGFLGKRVLVVDDVCDTGDTMSAIIMCKEINKGRVLSTATLHLKPWSFFEPDYHAEETKNWLQYPWEVSNE